MTDKEKLEFLKSIQPKIEEIYKSEFLSVYQPLFSSRFTFVKGYLKESIEILEHRIKGDQGYK